MESYSVEAVLKASGATQFAKAFQNASKSVQGVDKNASKAAISISSMMKAIIGSTAVVGTFRAIRNSIDGAISRFDTLNSFPRVLQMMGFEASESEKSIKKLSDGIQGLPTTLDEVAKTTQRLALMTGDLEGATETTLALNNAFLASGASGQDAARGLEQFVQMLATGKVDMDAWTTLQETMPYALNKTAEAFGFTGESGKAATQELYDALKSGNITFDEFNSQIVKLNDGVGGFAELAQDATGGIATSWGNLKNAIVVGVSDMIGMIDESLASFGGISGVLDRAKAAVNNTFGAINSFIPKVIDGFQKVYNAIKPWIPTIGEVKSAFTTTFQAISDFVQPILNTIVEFIMTTWGNLVQWWQQHGEMIVQGAQNMMNFIWNIMQAIWPVIQSLIVSTWDAIKGTIQGAIDVITGIIQFFSALFTGNWSALWDSVKQIVSGAVQFVWNLIQVIFVGRIIKAGKTLLNSLKSIVTSLWNGIKSLFTNGVNTITMLLTLVLMQLETLFPA